MKRLYGIAVVLVIAMIVCSCDGFWNFANVDSPPPPPEDFSEADLDDTLKKFLEGTFKDKVFEGEGVFDYKLEVDTENAKGLIRYSINKSFEQYEDLVEQGSQGTEFVPPQDLVLKGNYNNYISEDNQFKTTIYIYKSQMYLDVTEYKKPSGQSQIELGKYKDVTALPFITIMMGFGDFDVLNLLGKRTAFTVETAKQYIESVKSVTRFGKTYYEFFLTDEGKEEYLGKIDQAEGNYTYRLIYVVKNNDITELYLTVQNEQGEKQEAWAKNVKSYDLTMPDFSSFDKSYKELISGGGSGN